MTKRPDSALSSLIPPDIASRCHAVPLREEDGKLFIGFVNPGDRQAVNAVYNHLGRGFEIASITQQDLEQYLEINEAFHRIIADASGNRILGDYIDNILARTNVFIVFYDPFYDIDTNPSIEEHRHILKALQEKDEEKVVSLMQEHLKASQETLAKPEEEEEYS